MKVNVRNLTNTHIYMSSFCVLMLSLSFGVIGVQSLRAETQRNEVSALSQLAATIWGENNVWLPGKKLYVQYEPDLGERSMVDFEHGTATVQILVNKEVDHTSDLVLAHLRQGVGNLVLGNGSDPYEMLETFVAVKKRPVRLDMQGNRIPPQVDVRVYLTQRGDSLWKVAKRFYMTTKELAELNDITEDTVLAVGRPLKVKIFSSHDLSLEPSYPKPGKGVQLLDQIRMVDGSPVPHWLVEDFAAQTIGASTHTEMVVGSDGITRKAVSVTFKLVANHLELRARKFHPLVQNYATARNLDPALIMAIIHTESMFNPRARSRTPAFGLMQLVPHTGAKDAYQRLHGKKRKISPKYLYDPKNNIELGVTYFTILKEKYLKSIDDPESRTYCAVAAYNTGAANVGRAFIPRKSITQASPVINAMTAEDVYTRLVEELPFKEGRGYVKKVIGRRDLYAKW